jgi:hypothetical protein
MAGALNPLHALTFIILGFCPGMPWPHMQNRIAARTFGIIPFQIYIAYSAPFLPVVPK